MNFTLKKIVIIVSLLLTSNLTIPFNIQDQLADQSFGSEIKVELYKAIEEFDCERLASILALMGPLGKEVKALPLLTLYKHRDDIFAQGLMLRTKMLMHNAYNFDVKAFGSLSFAALSLSLGVVGGLNALYLPNLIMLNRVLLGVASLSALALCSYTIYILAKNKQQKIADQNELLDPFNHKLEIINAMIWLLENHPEN